MKKIITEIILFLRGLRIYMTDLAHYMRYSNISMQNETESKLLCTLIASYHIIEKGLSMPDRRLGFGRDALIQLIGKCKKYMALYGNNNVQVRYALGIIKEYDVIHKQSNFKLDKELQSVIDDILCNQDIEPAEQLLISSDEFFSNKLASFDKFSASRHSTRHFGGKISIDTIKEALKLAQNAPSACNKQPILSYVVEDSTKVKEILDMQQGNRGFGHLIDKLIVITTRYAGCLRYEDRFYPFIDAGIYCMNLLYALHFKEIGAIPLIWLDSSERNERLLSIIHANSEEIPCLIIGIGKVAEHVICATSPRKDLNEIVKIVE